MDPLLKAEMQGRVFTTATLLQIEFPSTTVRWTDGGFVKWGADTFLSRPTLGTLGGLPKISDGDGQQTQRLEIELLPADDASAALICNPLAQGSPVSWWEGAVDPDTGLLVGEPRSKFVGELDYASFSVGESWAVTVHCGTQAERQLEPNADWRLNNAFHQLIWPGELGLEHVTNVLRKIYWRMEAPGGGITRGQVRDMIFGGRGQQRTNR